MTQASVKSFWTGARIQRFSFPTWQGHSVGRWEGDTLVVDTVGFNDRVSLTLAEHPQTETMHVVERFRRLDLGRLEIDMLDDPGVVLEAMEGASNVDACSEGRVAGGRVRGEQQGGGARGGPVTRCERVFRRERGICRHRGYDKGWNVEFEGVAP